MERRYEVRLAEMSAQAEISPELMRDLLKRLESFAVPFAESLSGARRRHVAEGCANGFWHCLHCAFVFALKGRHRRARGNAPGCPKRPKPQP